MAMDLVDLNTDGIREIMMSELEMDIANEAVYYSVLFLPGVQDDYLRLLKQAIMYQDDAWLASNIRGLFRATNDKGHKVPFNAAERQAQGEFNKLYIRAVCIKAQEMGKGIEVYRARQSKTPRPGSEELIGKVFEDKKLQEILDDVRSSPGSDTLFGLPGGANSGISARINTIWV